uniref:GDP-mannose 4,6-dehydratase n=1 Tax=Lachnospira sp. TaxID=2049031 RepID=UPI004024BAC6
YEVTVTKTEKETLAMDGAVVKNLDILDKNQISELLNEEKPDYLFHLAAQSSVAYSWKNPTLTVDVNIKGCVNLLEAVKDADEKPRVLLIGSGEEYGHIKKDECPIIEDNVLRPGNIYAATKSCQNMLGKIYSDAYGLDIMMVRAFNHIGPNQTPVFVVADFCKQVADIEKEKQEPVIYVGNLSAKRDFTDVRDVVKAYALLVKGGKRGETYNVGRGHAVAIEDILKEIVSMSDKDIEVKVDEKKLRPVDVPIIEPDIEKIKKEVGWEPVIELRQTLEETLEYWRSSDRD